MLYKRHKVEWNSAGGKAQCAPDPSFPNGLVLDASGGASETCTVDLPYPAECKGTWVVTCETCGLRVGATAAGRTDDPRQFILPCFIKQLGGQPNEVSRLPYQGE